MARPGRGRGGEEAQEEARHHGHAPASGADGRRPRGPHREDGAARAQVQRPHGLREGHTGQEQREPELGLPRGGRRGQRLLQVRAALPRARGRPEAACRAGPQGHHGPGAEAGERAEQRLRGGHGRRAEAPAEGGRFQERRAHGGRRPEEQAGLQRQDRARHEVPPRGGPVRGAVRGRPLQHRRGEAAGGEPHVLLGDEAGRGGRGGDAGGRDPERDEGEHPQPAERGREMDERPEGRRRAVGQGDRAIRAQAGAQQRHQEGEAGQREGRAARGLGGALRRAPVAELLHQHEDAEGHVEAPDHRELAGEVRPGPGEQRRGAGGRGDRRGPQALRGGRPGGAGGRLQPQRAGEEGRGPGAAA
mmetsp:Transcript_4802/g.15062  ORF Transcript_4802/g.15062 Transcript_4802/m.15062 type:complete len:361 (+) Transcript_4802:234-1316(+)